MLGHCLGDDHAIEGIAVMERECSELPCAGGIEIERLYIHLFEQLENVGIENQISDRPFDRDFRDAHGAEEQPVGRIFHETHVPAFHLFGAACQPQKNVCIYENIHRYPP